MRHATGLLAIVALSGIALADAPKTPPPKAASFTDHAKLLDPIRVESLSVTPIIATGALPKTEDLLVLDEAMAKKLVKIKEIEDGQVNSLTLTNTADHPLFVLAGEVIIGGKQDRIIGRNTIIPPKKTLDVPVFCVEHGRWEGETKEFTTAKALAHGRLRGQASYASQQAVWNEVADKNEKRKTKTSTDTYRKVAAEQADGAMSKWETKVNASLDKLSADDRAHLVGFAVAINGDIATVDVFQSPALLAKLQGKLVRSYITDAVDVDAKADVKPPTSAQVEAFVADAEKAKAEHSYDNDISSTSVKKGDKANRAKVVYKPAPAKGGKTYEFEDDEVEGSVYLNYNAK